MGKLEERFPKKRILITGATSGLGEALAYALAERGWKVAISGRDADAVKRTVDEVNRRGGTGKRLTLEVRNKAQWATTQQALKKSWGGIDILCNNAGVADSNKMLAMSDADWEKLLTINLDGVINGCRTFTPDFVAQNSGYILNVASIAGLLSMPEMANYSVSKAGVISLSETMYTEFSGANVGVTVLCPSGFRSNLLENAAKDGRHATKNSSVARTIQADMEKGVHTSETVAAYAIKDMERGVLFSVPMPLYRLAWTLKRIAPNTFYKTVGWLYRKQLGPFSN